MFDEEAQSLSESTGELHLLCIWFEPVFKDGVYQKSDVLRQEKYIKLSELNFDSKSYKPYYVDADALFAEYQPNYFESKIDIENLHKVRLQNIAKKRKEREHLQEGKEQKIIEIKEN